jgi:hypothetical protein
MGLWIRIPFAHGCVSAFFFSVLVCLGHTDRFTNIIFNGTWQTRTYTTNTPNTKDERKLRRGIVTYDTTNVKLEMNNTSPFTLNFKTDEQYFNH